MFCWAPPEVMAVLTSSAGMLSISDDPVPSLPFPLPPTMVNILVLVEIN